MRSDRAELLDRRTLLRGLAGSLVGTATLGASVSRAADQIPPLKDWTNNPSGMGSSLAALGFAIISDKNPQYKDPKRYGGDTPLAWALHIQNDFSPATWSFRGQPREVVRSIRVPYHVIDDNRVVVEHVLIGWEALTDDERPNPEIDGSGNPDHRWKHFFSSGDFDPKVTAWSSDMELLGWLLMYSGNPLYDQSVTGEYKITGTVSGAKPNVAQINNWNDKIVQEKKKSAIWPFRSRPTRIDGSIRIPYRAYAKGPKEWYRVWLLVGYEGGGAI